MSTYERINDLIYNISPEVKLVLSVTLCSRSDKTGKKYSYHQEYEYNKQGESVITIRREAVPCMVFKTDNINHNVSFGEQQFDRLYQSLSSCKKWFDGSTQVYLKREGKLFIARDNPDRSPVIISELYDNKWISFEPIVIIGDSLSGAGIRMCLNNQLTVDISVDRFYGLVHVLTGFNMYMAMSSLLTYVNTCTPGTNMTCFGNGNNSFEGDVSGVNGRRQQTFKKSIFDD